MQILILGNARVLVGTQSGFADSATRLGNVNVYYDTLLVE